MGLPHSPPPTPAAFEYSAVGEAAACESDAPTQTKLRKSPEREISRITRSHGSVASVVRATREVNGRRQTYPSHHTHTP